MVRYGIHSNWRLMMLVIVIAGFVSVHRGMPVLAWAAFPLEAFRYTRSTLKLFRSSEHGQREFCGDCGSQLLFRYITSATSVDVNIGTLDKPTQVKPECHIWTESQINWFDIADELPRHRQDIPEHKT